MEYWMKPFWKIFLGIFFYVTAVVGLVLAVISASAKPVATSEAMVTGAIAAVCLIAGIVVSRKPRY
jgi:hypothetical protein